MHSSSGGQKLYYTVSDITPVGVMISVLFLYCIITYYIIIFYYTVSDIITLVGVIVSETV